MMDREPARAEYLTLSDYQRRLPDEPSRLIDGLMVHSRMEGFSCPRCSEKMAGLQHGKRESCRSCALQFVSFGNGLYIWDKERGE